MKSVNFFARAALKTHIEENYKRDVQNQYINQAYPKAA